MPNKQSPSAVANSAVRAVLVGVSNDLVKRGLVTVPPQSVLAFFGNRCAYTGADLTGAKVEYDHAVPQNRTGGGLHLPGNLVPCTPQANSEKGGQHYHAYLANSTQPEVSRLGAAERAVLLARIEEWRRLTGYVALEAHTTALTATLVQHAADIKALVENLTEQAVATMAAPMPIAVADDDTDAAADARAAALDAAIPDADAQEDDSTAGPLPVAYQQLVDRNLAPGAFARAVFGQLAADNLLEAWLPRLLDVDYSRRAFRLGFPALTRQRDPANRYYTTSFAVGASEYHLCND